MDLDLNEVSAFVRVVRAGSFSAAAAELGVPKSTVSRRISRLEERLGSRLLQRTTRRMRLTEEGERYFEMVAQPLRTVNEASLALAEGGDVPRGVLRMTAPVDFGDVISAGHIAAFTEKYPEVHIVVELTNRVVDLVREGFDMAIRAGHMQDSTLIARRIGRSHLAAFASPEYIEKHGVPQSPAELADHKCVLFRSGPRKTRWELSRVGPAGTETAAVDVQGQVTASDFAFLRSLIARGLGIGLLPAFSGRRFVAEGKLVRVLPGWNTESGPIHIVYPTAQHMPAKLRAFRDHLLATLDVESWETMD